MKELKASFQSARREKVTWSSPRGVCGERSSDATRGTSSGSSTVLQDNHPRPQITEGCDKRQNSTRTHPARLCGSNSDVLEMRRAALEQSSPGPSSRSPGDAVGPTTSWPRPPATQKPSRAPRTTEQEQCPATVSPLHPRSPCHKMTRGRGRWAQEAGGLRGAPSGPERARVPGRKEEEPVCNINLFLLKQQSHDLASSL